MDARKAKRILSQHFDTEGDDLCMNHQAAHGLETGKMSCLHNAYIEFMVVKALGQDTGTKECGGMKFSASPEVDQVWHTHLLCTENYKRFMTSINLINPFVDFLHHSLAGSLDSDNEKNKRIQATRIAYQKLFGTNCEWLQGNKHHEDVKPAPEAMKGKISQGKNHNEDKSSTQAHRLTISIKCRTGKIFYIVINSTDSIEIIKEGIQQKEGIPIYQQRLIFKGQQLEDGKTAADYHLYNNAQLDLVLRLVGC